jgi:insulysin
VGVDIVDVDEIEIDSTEAEVEPTFKILGPILKSPLDRRNYRGLLLSNGMKVILITDPNTTKSAASMAISAGSINDPDDMIGLAHFVEHMMFLGNEKYPEENGFQKFITEHGGFCNAATQADKTHYYYRVSPSALNHSLELYNNKKDSFIEK